QPDGTAANLRYDDNGRLAGMDAGDGEYVPQYDHVGSIVGWAEPNGERTSQQLDGGLPSELDWTGLVSGSITLGRDALGQITSLSIGTAPPISFSYDADGLPAKVGDLSIRRDPATGRAAST